MTEISGEIGKERILGALLKTGQTTRYGGYLDDGYYRKGLSKQYTILTAGQYAGTTPITVATKTDLISNNCVYDPRTKLMWSRYLSDGLGPGNDGKMPWTTDGAGHGIFPFVAAANAAKLAGYDDWRIPNLFELVSLIIIQPGIVSPDIAAFPGFPLTDRINTSTTWPPDISCYIGPYFLYAYLGAESKTNNKPVTLVRGG